MPISEEEAKKIFNLCDSNKDGNVTKLELLKGLNTYFSKSLSTDDVADMFSGLDEDKSNTITWDEFKSQLCDKLNRREAFGKAFNDMDKNKDGTLSRDELTSACKTTGYSDEEIEDLIQDLDADGDGKITKKEFMVMV